MIRALIVDDEPLARSRIRHMLQAHTDVSVVAECSDGREAVEVAVEERPDLIFLDMAMPQVGGLEAAAALTKETPLAIVFVTAHEEFALSAFEASGLDYLVKPFSQERFDRAMYRVRRFLGGQPVPRRARTQPAEEETTQRRRRDRFAVRVRGQIVFIRAVAIDWIASEGNYARLHTGGTSYLIRESLQNLEEVLDRNMFVRVHRSAIVNIDRVEKLVPATDGALSIVLQNETVVPLGPSFRERLEDVLGQKL
ncbi:MAG TPA: LytTR family DNA-binding domain-containing protein [Thermoanaerobaculia bacterium]|nr:LytTR family DNA-binding domain-containing protein [Thermoanaerobaculia bacterium]